LGHSIGHWVSNQIPDLKVAINEPFPVLCFTYVSHYIPLKIPLNPLKKPMKYPFRSHQNPMNTSPVPAFGDPFAKSLPSSRPPHQDIFQADELGYDGDIIAMKIR
jgi:hypothetical protein